MTLEQAIEEAIRRSRLDFMAHVVILVQEDDTNVTVGDYDVIKHSQSLRYTDITRVGIVRMGGDYRTLGDHEA